MPSPTATSSVASGSTSEGPEGGDEHEPRRHARGAGRRAAVDRRRGAARGRRGARPPSPPGATRRLPVRGTHPVPRLADHGPGEGGARPPADPRGRQDRQGVAGRDPAHHQRASSTRPRRAGGWAGETVPSELPRNFCYTLRQPLGVVVCITPWNFPVAIPVLEDRARAGQRQHRRVQARHAHAGDGRGRRLDLRAGRACPRASSTWCWARAARWATRSSTTTAVRAVSFTGSNEVGARDLRAAARARMIRVAVRDGRQEPVVVMADADLDVAVEATAQGAFGSTGQRCTATSRVIVEEDDRGHASSSGWPRARRRSAIGNGLDDGVDMGPAVDRRRSSTRTCDYIEIGQERGRPAASRGGGACRAATTTTATSWSRPCSTT